MNGHATKMMPVAADDIKHAYMERVYAMSHAELFHELMRVHGESARLLQMAQTEFERVKNTLSQYESVH